MREAAHDYRMDARLVAECGDEVGSFRESLYNLPRYILRAPSVAVVEEMELDLRQMLSKRHSPLSYFSVFCVATERGSQSVIVFTDVMLKTLAELLCFLNSILTILLLGCPKPFRRIRDLFSRARQYSFVCAVTVPMTRNFLLSCSKELSK